MFHSLKIAPAKRLLGVEALPKHGFGGAAGLAVACGPDEWWERRYAIR